MAKQHGGLGGQGQGLSALFGASVQRVKEGETPTKNQVQELPIEKIQANRYQPRREFDEAAMEELRASVAAYGVLQPVLVRRLPSGGYELVAGERRLRAAKLAGLSTVPALVREYNDGELSEIALIENLQREDLGPLEEASAYQQLIEKFHLTQEELSAKVGRSRSHIANFLRLLKLDAKVQDYLSDGTLTMGQAKPLVALTDKALQREAADYIQEHELSARASEALVKRLLADPDFFRSENVKREKAPQDVHLRAAQDHLAEFLGTQVRIVPGKKKSQIQIAYYSEEDLTRILELLAGREHAAESERDRRIAALREFSRGGKFTV